VQPAGDDRRQVGRYRRNVRLLFGSLSARSFWGARMRLDDLALALAVGCLQLGVTALAATHRSHPGVGPVTVLLLAVGPLALVVRRRWPAAVLAIAFSVALVYSALDLWPRGLVFPALVVAFWQAMSGGRRFAGWLSLVGGYLVFVVLLPATGAQAWPSAAWASGIAAWMLLLGASAELLRVWRQRARERAAAQAAELRRLAGEERLRIARDLHDVLAHNLSLINVQAGVALHLVDERPEQSRAALAAIKQASKDALEEVRSVLEVLRHPDEPAPRAPAPGTERFDELIARTRATGLPIDARLDQIPKGLPEGVDRAAYRIVQEALTNVTRHAPGAATHVRVHRNGGYLLVEVTNGPAASGDLSGARNGAAGSGIRGMRERVRALGGEVEVGPQPAGGFRVQARLPLEPAR